MLEASDSIDSFDLQDLGDVVDTYNASLSEPNRFFGLLREQLQQEDVDREGVIEMNKVADGVDATPNAAIEAARAGDEGRGFAVVADGVRTFAVRTRQSTDESEGMIRSLEEGAQRAMNSMSDSVEGAGQTATFVESAGSAFEGIAKSMRTIFDMSSQIATAAEEQSVMTSEVAKNVHMIAEIAERTAASAEEVSARGESLEALADRLQAQVSRFTPGEAVES